MEGRGSQLGEESSSSGGGQHVARGTAVNSQAKREESL